jgi:hypothetical protein
MYVDVSLSLSPEQIKRLAQGLRIRVTKQNVASHGSFDSISVTSTQAASIQRIASGQQGWMLLKMSGPALKRTAQNGSGFFDSVGSFFKDTFTKPSGILGVASMLPGPLSLPLKAASVVTKLTGNGVRRGSGFFDNVGDFFKDTFTKPSGILGVASMLPGPLGLPLKAASIGAKLAGHGVKGGTFGKVQHPVDEALLGMGFKAHHVAHMKGSGVFSSLWKAGRKLGSYIIPIAKRKGLALLKEYGPGLAKRAAEKAIGRMGGRGVMSHYVKFSPAQKRCIVENMHGSGIFSDIKDKISDFVHAARPAFKFLGRRGGNLATLGSIH